MVGRNNIFPNLPCVRHSLSCHSQRTYGHVYVTHNSVSKPTTWAVAGPHGQLASIVSLEPQYHPACDNITDKLPSTTRLHYP